MENLHLVVGLGNPGRDYARTRHNAGFMAVEKLAERRHAEWTMEERFHARLARADFEGWRLLLGEPQTYMNLSGESVGRLKEYFRVATARLLVVVDDAD